MKKYAVLVFIVFAVGIAGCSGKFWAGTGTGAIGSAAAYELNANKEMKRIDDDFKAGKMDQAEYNIRKDQVKRMSVYQTIKK